MSKSSATFQRPAVAVLAAPLMIVDAATPP
jgi:hypothetical protein